MGEVVEEKRQRISIPEMSETELHKLSEQVRPVKDFRSFSQKTGLHFIEMKPLDTPDLHLSVPFLENARPATKADGLRVLADITTYHIFARGHHAYFKPTISEVLRQIPEEYLDRVVAFEIVERVEENGHMNEGWKVIQDSDGESGGLHSVTTRLYVPKE